MQVIRNDKGEVTKVIITEKEFAETSKDYKGEHDGKRSWMPPFDVFGTTCSLTEGPRFEIIDKPRTKKFWCHYIGSDGNTPKRRSMELSNLGDLIPAIGENAQAPTPLWYEDDAEGILAYAQLSDTVAVRIPRGGIFTEDVRLLQKNDGEIDKDWDEWYHKQLETFPNVSEKYKAEEFDSSIRHADEDKAKRKRGIAILQSYMDFTTFLLTKASWITEHELRAYAEIASPYLPTLQALRKQFQEQRAEEDRKERERRRQREEEEKRKKAEEEAKEQQRLTEEAKKFKAGQSIAGGDVVELCRRYGINIHLRTVHNLQQVVSEINGKDNTCRYWKEGKRTPVLDGCYKTATELYEYLQTHEVE